MCIHSYDNTTTPGVLLPQSRNPTPYLIFIPESAPPSHLWVGNAAYDESSDYNADRFRRKRCSSREIMYFLVMCSLAIEVEVVESNDLDRRMILDP